MWYVDDHDLTSKKRGTQMADHIAEIIEVSRGVTKRPTTKQIAEIERSARKLAYSDEGGDVETTFNRTFPYRRLDGAYATMQVMNDFFGVTLGRDIQTFFGPEPPEMITANTGVGETAQVPWGILEIPSLDRAKLRTRVAASPMGGVFKLQITARRKHQDTVEDFFNAVEAYLREHSLYHGKATVGCESPEFVDTSKIDLDDVVYSQAAETMLDGTLFSVMRHSDQMRKDGLPLKRAILLHGPYGTGKSLTGRKVAKVAVETGWTFVSAKTGYDSLEDAMNMARLYAPAVVFFEDVDTELEPDDDGEEDITRLLDVLDGITAKDQEILVVMTTNHIDRIHKGMLRPGRLDGLIELAALDQDGIKRVIGKAVKPKRLGDIDYAKVADAMQEFTPAFVRETVTRAASHALSRNGGKSGYLLGTTDLVRAAESLVPQLERMQDAKEDSPSSQLERGMKGVIADTINGSRFVDRSGDSVFGEASLATEANGKHK